MSYLELFREACESLGEGYFELVRGLLSPHLGDDPFAKVYEDPREFLRSLRVALGGEADSLLAALAATLKQRGADVNARSLERILESGDRGRVREIFERAYVTPLELSYRELMIRQLNGLLVSRRRRVIASSLLLALITLSLVFLMTMVLRDYLSRETVNGIMILGVIVSAALAAENYLINQAGAPKARLRLRVRVLNAPALARTRIPELASAFEGREALRLDLVELSRATSVPLPDLVGEMVRLQREGAIRMEFGD